MKLQFRPWQKTDLSQMTRMWNDILTDGDAFPGTELYEEGPFGAYLGEQTAATCLLLEGALAGYYILHPNNIGRCGHVANASYVLDRAFRGRGLGRPLVERSLEEAAALGFRGMQFNAVVAGNTAALRIYRGLGFQTVGTIPGGLPPARRDLLRHVCDVPVPGAGLNPGRGALGLLTNNAAGR